MSAPPLKRHVAAVTIGNALEFYDFLTYSFFAIYIGETFFPSTDPASSLLASLATFGAGFATRPLGGLVLGMLGDRWGRKPAMFLSFTLMGLGMLGVVFTPSYASIGVAAPVLLICFRLIQGFALGGEVGPTTAFLIEAPPPEQRGFYLAVARTHQVVRFDRIGCGLSSRELDTPPSIDGESRQLEAVIRATGGPAAVFAIGDGPVEVVEAVAGHLERNPLLSRFGFAQPDPGHLGVDEGRPGNDPIVGLERLEPPEKCIDGGVPGLVGGGMGELVRSGHISGAVDGGDAGAQEGVGGHGAALADVHPKFLKTETPDVGAPSDGDQDLIEGDFDPRSTVIADQTLALGGDQNLSGGVLYQNPDPFGGELRLHQCGNLRILARQEARSHLDLRYPAAEAGEGLSHLRADRSAAEHHQPARQLAQPPYRVRGEAADLVDTGNRRHERARAGGDHDRARGEAARLPRRLTVGRGYGRHPVSALAAGLAFLGRRRLARALDRRLRFGRGGAVVLLRCARARWLLRFALRRALGRRSAPGRPP